MFSFGNRLVKVVFILITKIYNKKTNKKNLHCLLQYILHCLLLFCFVLENNCNFSIVFANIYILKTVSSSCIILHMTESWENTLVCQQRIY